jgi:ATP-dependent exoDNAse (exonuclease V) alpha subunit
MEKLLPDQKLLIAGDFYQLPPVSNDTDIQTPIYDNWTHIKSEEYKQFRVLELTKNWRQKTDPEFFDLCQSIRGKLTEREAHRIIKVLNTRVVDYKTIENTTFDDIHICGVNYQVDNINKNYKLKVGCKVICNTTMFDKEKQKINNGSLGYITCMGPFTVDFGLGCCSTFPFYFSKKSQTVGTCKKSTKPRFMPAYGLTVHKAQGKTIKRHVIINPSRLFTKNHLYVALTRASTPDENFVPHGIP